MQAHPIPKYKNYVGFLFKNFESGVNAIRNLYEEGVYPSTTVFKMKTKLKWLFL